MSGAIPFERIMPGLKAWFTDATGLKCRLKNEPDAHKDVPHGILELRAVRALHVDEARASHAGGKLSYTLSGNRVLTVEMRVRSRSQEPRDTAWMPLEMARTQLRAPWSKEVLRGLGLAIVVIGTSQVFDAPWQDRMESIALFEVQFAVAANVTDKRSQDGVIDQAELTSQLKNQGGSSLDDGLQLDEEILP